jgi:hypothetical protein
MPANLVILPSPTVREQWHKPKASFVKSPSRRSRRADGVLSFQVLLVKKPKAQFLEQVSVGLNRKDFQGFVNERV